jgi:hypothetical protein
LPKLYVVTINEVSGELFGGVVVGAAKLDRSNEMTVRTNDICPVLYHRIPSPSVFPAGTRKARRSLYTSEHKPK